MHKILALQSHSACTEIPDERTHRVRRLPYIHIQVHGSPEARRSDAAYRTRGQTDSGRTDHARAGRGQPAPHPTERICFRCASRFEVERADLAWMTQALFIGTGARLSDRVKMVFYEVL